MKGKTTIIISHDLNLIRQADRIVVLREGKIDQVGTHLSLLEAGGQYADLYSRQFGQAQVAPSSHPGEAPRPARLWNRFPLSESPMATMARL
jgi:ABC-type proline/glycine betaine transport system ATPase subunit